MLFDRILKLLFKCGAQKSVYLQGPCSVEEALCEDTNHCFCCADFGLHLSGGVIPKDQTVVVQKLATPALLRPSCM